MSGFRHCRDCPDRTRTACVFAFGRGWRVKSRGGEGCAHPLDAVAESWRAAGWTPGGRPSARKGPAPAPSAKNAPVQLTLFAPPLGDDDY